MRWLKARVGMAALALGLVGSAHLSAQTADSTGAGMAGMPGMGTAPVDPLEAPSGRAIVPMIKSPMIPGLEGARPTVALYEPGAGRAAQSVPAAAPSSELQVKSGDTVTLTASFVRRTIAGRSFITYGFNGQTPGPLIRVTQGATFYVRFKNDVDQPATIHWHGVRIQNAYDGSPQVTQAPVPPGGAFIYAVHCPDAGIFWYHDHVREDIGQPLGLYGNLYVDANPSAGSSPRPRQAFLILSDILIDGDSLMPYGRDAPNFSLMGRFGNVLLVNGESRWRFAAAAGDVVRFLITNAASARTFNLSFGEAAMKLVALGQSPYARRLPCRASSSHLVSGTWLTSISTGLDVCRCSMRSKQSTTSWARSIPTRYVGPRHGLGRSPRGRRPGICGAARRQRDDVRHRETEAGVGQSPGRGDRPDYGDSRIADPRDADDGGRHGLSTTRRVDRRHGRHELAVDRDGGPVDHSRRADGRRKHAHCVALSCRRCDQDPRLQRPALVPSQWIHPLHLHGQRFLEVARDGVANPYLVWKDTAIIPVGSTVDLLVEFSNPGRGCYTVTLPSTWSRV